MGNVFDNMIKNLKNENFIKGIASSLPSQVEPNIEVHNKYNEYQNKNVKTEFCYVCGGTGGLKAMQLAYIAPKQSVRTHDTKVNCNDCKGTGVKIKYY